MPAESREKSFHSKAVYEHQAGGQKEGMGLFPGKRSAQWVTT